MDEPSKNTNILSSLSSSSKDIKKIEDPDIQTNINKVNTPSNSNTNKNTLDQAPTTRIIENFNSNNLFNKNEVIQNTNLVSNLAAQTQNTLSGLHLQLTGSKINQLSSVLSNQQQNNNSQILQNSTLLNPTISNLYPNNAILNNSLLQQLQNQNLLSQLPYLQGATNPLMGLLQQSYLNGNINNNNPQNLRGLYNQFGQINPNINNINNQIGLLSQLNQYNQIAQNIMGNNNPINQINQLNSLNQLFSTNQNSQQQQNIQDISRGLDIGQMVSQIIPNNGIGYIGNNTILGNASNLDIELLKQNLMKK